MEAAGYSRPAAERHTLVIAAGNDSTCDTPWGSAPGVHPGPPAITAGAGRWRGSAASWAGAPV